MGALVVEFREIEIRRLRSASDIVVARGWPVVTIIPKKGDGARGGRRCAVCVPALPTLASKRDFLFEEKTQTDDTLDEEMGYGEPAHTGGM